MKKAIRIILVLAVLGAGGYAAYRMWGANGADANRIVLHGNIELTEVDLSFKQPGRLVELKVDEGAQVRQGDILARMDEIELTTTRDRENATRSMAQSNLAQLLTSIQFQKESIAGDVELKHADLRAAESRLKELETGSRKQEVEQARAGSAEAETQFKLASADWERAQRLYKNEDISTAQFDQARTRFEATRATLQRSRDTLSLVVEGPRKETIDQARAQVERARAAVRLAEANRIDLRRREQEVAARNADVARSDAQVKIFQTQLNDRALVAPIDAVVLSKSGEVGEVLAAGAAILTLGDLAHPWVRGYVPETQLGRVKIGQTVEVSTDSFKGKKYTGRITFISSQAEFTPKSIQTQDERVKLVYRIKVEVANPNQELKNNMPVDAVIQLEGKS
jgi:HlyD family secretion protein